MKSFMALTPNFGSNMILPEGFSGSSIFYLLSFGYQLWEHGLVGRREAGREGRFAVLFF